jgi:transcription initiation factor TFIIIB Brf1 subunit/transcription initiation factor TFIIB
MKIEKKSLMPENTPNSTAAGIIYFVCQICNLNISKKEVKNVTNTSEVTVNKCYKKIEKLSDGLVPKAILKKYQ